MKEVKSRICCWLLCCLAAGCADRDTSPADDAPRNPAACGVSLSLAFSVDGSGPDASGTGEAPGFDSENAIRNLYVFTEVSGRRTAYPFRHVLLDEDGTTGRKSLWWVSSSADLRTIPCSIASWVCCSGLGMQSC